MTKYIIFVCLIFAHNSVFDCIIFTHIFAVKVPLGMHQTVSLFFLPRSLTQMAHRLLLRRICTVAVNDVRGLSLSSTRAASSCFSTSMQSAAPRLCFLSTSRTVPRSLPHTSRREVSFNVQDQEDFTERVINSQLPVLIDFHAQWVVGKLTDLRRCSEVMIIFWLTYLNSCEFHLSWPSL